LLIGLPKLTARSIEELAHQLATRAEEIIPTLEERAGLYEDRFGAESRLLKELPVRIALAIPGLERAQLGELDSPTLSAPLLSAEDLSEESLPRVVNDVMASSGSTKPLSEREERIVRGLLHPEIVIDSPDDEAADQLIFAPPAEGAEDLVRVLDRQQERLARDLGGGYRVIRGVAGSGKTLVLAFRARFLAEHFPSWRILLTCFNI
jgi:hypothetical protein